MATKLSPKKTTVVLGLHDQHVIDVVPPERLLVMHVKEGWAPLARFLGKPEPTDIPFPQVNETQALDRQAKALFSNLVWTWVRVLAVAGGAAYGLGTLWRNLRRS